MYAGKVTRIKNLRKHINADRLQIGECLGNQVVVGMDIEPDELVVYFPSGGELGKQFAEQNKLLRPEGFLDPEKRKVQAISLRGQRSDGLVLKMDCIKPYCTVLPEEGAEITILDGIQICQEYRPKIKDRTQKGAVKSTFKNDSEICPSFARMLDIDRLEYKLDAFSSGDIIEITEKLHGTSGRVACLPVLQEDKCNGLIDKLLIKLHIKQAPEKYDYGIVSGTRRCVFERFSGAEEYRNTALDFFSDKLYAGETVYFEIVGFRDNGTSIMPSALNETLGKQFVKEYGHKTVFSYGCDPDGEDGKLKNDFYVYRMTMTNRSGYVVEYSPAQLRYRCEQMGCKLVPHILTFMIPYETELDGSAGDYVLKMADAFCSGPSTVDQSHIREGVVVRVVNNPYYKAYKHKNYEFKVLSGIAIENAEKSGGFDDVPDDVLNEM